MPIEGLYPYEVHWPGAAPMNTPTANRQLETLAEEVFSLTNLTYRMRARAQRGQPVEALTETEYLTLDMLSREATLTVGQIQKGIGVLPGVVEELDALPLPHMGWNTVSPPSASAMFAGVEDQRFYFVHSFGVHEVPDWPANARITWTEHGGDRFIAAVEQGPLWSVQFHPEKSGEAGGRLLRNWLGTLRKES